MTIRISLKRRRLRLATRAASWPTICSGGGCRTPRTKNSGKQRNSHCRILTAPTEKLSYYRPETASPRQTKHNIGNIYMALYGAIEAGGTKFVCAVGAEIRGQMNIWQRLSIPTTTPEETL